MRTIAMILAGGEGTRLTVLSEERAKPAVPFAGKFRIIDFTLSNCVNSGIYTVGVLTQYRPHSLNDHIGIGKPWDLDRSRGGVRLLAALSGAARPELVCRHGRCHLPEPGFHPPEPGRQRGDPVGRPHLQDGLSPHDRLPHRQGRRSDDRRHAGADRRDEPLRHHAGG